MEKARLMGATRPELYSPLVLAYIGDAVYELFVRERLIKGSSMPAGQLHRFATRYVSAAGQAASYHEIKSVLTEEEQNIFARGRNAKHTNLPQNTPVSQYHHATGFEALLGYLKIKGDEERLGQIMQLAAEARERRAAP